jgi:hypothetical protein
MPDDMQQVKTRLSVVSSFLLLVVLLFVVVPFFSLQCHERIPEIGRRSESAIALQTPGDGLCFFHAYEIAKADRWQTYKPHTGRMTAYRAYIETFDAKTQHHLMTKHFFEREDIEKERRILYDILKHDRHHGAVFPDGVFWKVVLEKIDPSTRIELAERTNGVDVLLKHDIEDEKIYLEDGRAEVEGFKKTVLLSRNRNHFEPLVLTS